MGGERDRESERENVKNGNFYLNLSFDQQNTLINTNLLAIKN